jgi:chloride channel protein, CIC family
MIDSVLLGVGGAFAAQAFVLLVRVTQTFFLSFLAGYHPPGLLNEGGSPQEVIGRFGMWLVPLSLTIGGLLVGVLVQQFGPETEGHGTDTAVRAFHRAEGALRARVPPLKMVASAITIGSGGSAGREGPAALMAAGIGSLYASVTERDAEDRRLLLLIGMSAGLAAIFRSPIGTALFAIEVLYSDMEFETGALLYTMLASIVAYAVNGIFVGFTPLFRIPALQVPGTLDYVWFAALGVGAGLVAVLLPMVFYGVRDLFRRLRVPDAFKPAIGGLGVGLIALVLPQVIGGGYGWMQSAIDGRIAVGTLLVLVFAKIVAMSLTVSSGGSGGVFAPSLYVGTMLGAFFAEAVHKAPAPFAIVGMAAVFAGAAKVPVASLLMVTEMTGGYTLLVPAALAVMLSYVIQTRLSARLKYRRLYQEQVPRRHDSPAHHSEHLEIALQILEHRRLAEPLDPDHLALLSRLRSGEEAELPDAQRLFVGVLRKESSLVGKSPLDNGEEIAGDVKIIAIMRGEHMEVPRPGTVLAAGDRLVLLATPTGLQRVRQHVVPW